MNGEAQWEAKIDELMEAVDKNVPLPERAIDQPFLMPIEDIFSISGRGTVVTGRIERGQVKVGEESEIVGFRETRKTVVTGVEMFKKQLDEGRAGDNAGLLLRGIAKEDVERGMVLAKPGSITPHTKFKGEIYVLSKEEGGRHTPFFNGYRPQFYFRTTDVTGTAKLPEGTEMVMPGDNISLRSSCTRRWRWRRVCGSPSAKAAGPSAPGPLPKLLSNEAEAGICSRMIGKSQREAGMHGGKLAPTSEVK